MAKMPTRIAPPKAAKPPSATQSTLNRAERIQKLETGESRIAKAMPPKSKPATPTMAPAARAATQSALARAERVQREEAGESALIRRAPQVVRTTVNYRATPTKKK